MSYTIGDTVKLLEVRGRVESGVIVAKEEKTVVGRFVWKKERSIDYPPYQARKDRGERGRSTSKLRRDDDE